jgi:hypothetical protein
MQDDPFAFADVITAWRDDGSDGEGGSVSDEEGAMFASPFHKRHTNPTHTSETRGGEGAGSHVEQTEHSSALDDTGLNGHDPVEAGEDGSGGDAGADEGKDDGGEGGGEGGGDEDARGDVTAEHTTRAIAALTAPYTPADSLRRAVDDAKILHVGFHLKAPKVVPVGLTWHIVNATDGEGTTPSQALPLVLVAQMERRRKQRRYRMCAQVNGTYIVDVPGAPLATYACLSDVIQTELKDVLEAGRHTPVPHTTVFHWVPDARWDADIAAANGAVPRGLTVENEAVYQAHLVRSRRRDAQQPLRGARAALRLTPYPQPHAILMTCVPTEGPTPAPVYVLGFHPETSTFFVADAVSHWARASHSLRALLETVYYAGDDAGAAVGASGASGAGGAGARNADDVDEDLGA